MKALTSWIEFTAITKMRNWSISCFPQNPLRTAFCTAFSQLNGFAGKGLIMRTIRKLGVEGLERRSMLAGNIHAEVNGGVLVITGDDAGNGVSVQQLGEGKY